MSDGPRVSDEMLAQFAKLVDDEEGETQRADFVFDLRDERAKTAEMREALRAQEAIDADEAVLLNRDHHRLAIWVKHLRRKVLGEKTFRIGEGLDPAEMTALVDRVIGEDGE